MNESRIAEERRTWSLSDREQVLAELATTKSGLKFAIIQIERDGEVIARLTERAERAEGLETALRELADHHGKEHTSFAGCSLVDIRVNRALAKSLSRDTL